MQIRLAGIVKESVTDGPGFRYAIFTQGCAHACEGCHNPETWDFNGGYLSDTFEIISQLDKNPLLKGITLTGGDPFYQAQPCTVIAKAAHLLGLDVFSFTGYTFEELIKVAENDESVASLLSETDFLVDGRFVLAQRSLELKFRGSENQRILNVRQSLEEGKAVLANEYMI